MSDWYETVVDPVVTSVDAPVVAERVISELVGAGLVKPEQTNCALGERGFPPAPGVLRYLKQPDELVMSLRTNGLAVLAKRTVHLSPAVERIVCLLCGATIDDLEKVHWQEAIGQWYEGAAGVLRCPVCLQEAPVSQWPHEPACGFGHLSFTFWNWPPFTSEYWRKTPVELIESASGHECVLVFGKL
jgi:hypothetical protein